MVPLGSMEPQANPYAPPTANVDQTAETGPDDYTLASRGARFFGAVLDSLVGGLIIVPAMFLLDVNFTRGAPDLFQLYSQLAIPFLLYVGIQWTLIATSGQSIGKKILGTKIVRLDGSPCGFVHGVILRSWITGAIGFIPFVGSIFGLVDALAIFGDERRCVHDMIAGTRVINMPIQG